jgi:hypothetical protein
VAAALKELIAARAPKVAGDGVFAPTLAYVAGLCAALQVGSVACRSLSWLLRSTGFRSAAAACSGSTPLILSFLTLEHLSYFLLLLLLLLYYAGHQEL